MKIRINIDEDLEEDEIIINCRELSDDVINIKNAVAETVKKVNLVFYKGGSEYFLPLGSILFFESSQNKVEAHTSDDVYIIKNKLYELEEILPKRFIRISKSTIVNVNRIYSIDRSLTSAGCVTFYKSHKQVYVSRNYNKKLKIGLEERRVTYE